MKKVLKSAEPLKLQTYRHNNVMGTWEQYKSSDSRKLAVTDTLKSDQAGICAYCEIKLLPKDQTGDADFRVEHFHPKSDSTPAHNWHLDWQNLLGCCHGGSQKNVADGANRFTKGDYSCDVPKENKVLDGVILNPLHIPAFPPLFSTERSTGCLKVNLTNCLNALVSEQKAAATISELRLDSARLNRFRKKILDKLNDEMMHLTDIGLSIEEAQLRLAKIFLCKDTQQHWPAFFTTIRSYLGTGAETHLNNINYSG